MMDKNTKILVGALLLAGIGYFVWKSKKSKEKSFSGGEGFFNADGGLPQIPPMVGSSTKRQYTGTWIVGAVNAQGNQFFFPLGNPEKGHFLQGEIKGMKLGDTIKFSS